MKDVLPTPTIQHRSLDGYRLKQVLPQIKPKHHSPPPPSEKIIAQNRISDVDLDLDKTDHHHIVTQDGHHCDIKTPLPTSPPLRHKLVQSPPTGGDRLGRTHNKPCLLYTSPSPRDGLLSRMPSSA